MDNIKNILQINKKYGNPVNIQLHLRVDLPLDRLKKNRDLNFFKKYLDPKSITWLEVYEHWSGLIKEKDIPKGAVRQPTPDGIHTDYTVWTSVVDTQNSIYYYKTYKNQRIKKMVLKDVLKQVKGKMTVIKAETPRTYETVSTK